MERKALPDNNQNLIQSSATWESEIGEIFALKLTTSWYFNALIRYNELASNDEEIDSVALQKHSSQRQSFSKQE